MIWILHVVTLIWGMKQVFKKIKIKITNKEAYCEFPVKSDNIYCLYPLLLESILTSHVPHIPGSACTSLLLSLLKGFDLPGVALNYLLFRHALSLPFKVDNSLRKCCHLQLQLIIFRLHQVCRFWCQASWMLFWSYIIYVVIRAYIFRVHQEKKGNSHYSLILYIVKG